MRNAILESDVIIGSVYFVRFSLRSSLSIGGRVARIAAFILFVLAATASFASVYAQTDSSPFPQPTELQQGPPLTNDEFVRRLNQLRANPEEIAKLVDEVRKRGIGFPITPGLRSLIATRSGNDSSLLHTLDEAN